MPQLGERPEKLCVEMCRVARFAKLFCGFVLGIEGRTKHIVQENKVTAEIFVPCPPIRAVVPGVEMWRGDEIARPSRSIDVAVPVAVHE